MNHEQKMTCDDFASLLIKKTTGELLPVEKDFLEAHLAYCASCASDEQELSRAWNRYGDLPLPEIPIELYEKTRERILGQLRQEKSLYPWAGRLPIKGIWSVFLSILAGLVMTAVSFFLLRNSVGAELYHYYVFIPLFGLWWLLFTACFWLVFKSTHDGLSQLNAVITGSISIAFLTLLISFLVYELQSLTWPAIIAAYRLAVVSHYLFGLGNTFVAAWWIHCCLASFVGTFIFGVRSTPPLSQKLFLGSLLATILLSPAIYLQGASHNHGYGIIAFAALGTYAGALLGMGTGLFIRRRFSFQAA
jgi:hypothetical protein